MNTAERKTYGTKSAARASAKNECKKVLNSKFYEAHEGVDFDIHEFRPHGALRNRYTFNVKVCA